MNRKLLQTSFGLKWNPFSPDVPVEALWVPPAIALFCSRLEYQAREGGFALVSGDPGSGKSVTLRLLAHQLDGLGDVVVGVLSRPQSHVADFYRELGHLFGVPLSPHNRWAGAKVLREKASWSTRHSRCDLPWWQNCVCLRAQTSTRDPCSPSSSQETVGCWLSSSRTR